MASTSVSVPADITVKGDIFDVGGYGNVYAVFSSRYESVTAHFRYGNKEIEWEITCEDNLFKITIPFDLIVEITLWPYFFKPDKPPASQLTVLFKSPPNYFKWNPKKNQWLIHKDFTKGEDGSAFIPMHMLETKLGLLDEAYHRLKVADPRFKENTFPSYTPRGISYTLMMK